MNRNSMLSIVLVAILIVSLGMVAYLYVQNQNLNQQLTTDKADSTRILYYSTLTHILSDNKNNSFAPPVSLFNALMTAFQYSGWTDDTLMELNATRVDAKLVYGYVNTASNTTVVVGAATPQADYSNFVVDGITYQYMWQVVAYDASADLMPLTHDGYSLVDAITGAFLPIPSS
jgi:hypothetical protein